MMLKIYSIFIQLYGFLIRMAALRSTQAKLWVKGRDNWRTRYAASLKSLNKPIWIHCASLGEFEQGRPLIEKLRKEYPTKAIVLTFFSPSGYEVRKTYDQVDQVLYLPIDTKSNARDFIAILNPSLVLFVKYEFWFNYLKVLQERAIPIVYFSTIFRENHFLFKGPAKSLLAILKKCNQIFVQDEDSLNRLKEKGFDNISLAFDTRFDRVWNTAQTALDDTSVLQFAKGRKVLLIGSAWSPDIDALNSALSQFDFQEWCIAIAPHHIDAVTLEEIRCQLCVEERVQLYTEFDASLETDILLVNTMGKLSALYKMADFVMVGGGFGKAVHNVLEPAVFAKPITCGPRIQKFKEVLDLVAAGGIKVIEQPSDFAALWKANSMNEVELRKMGASNADYVAKRLGGTAVLFNYLRNVF